MEDWEKRERRKAIIRIIKKILAIIIIISLIAFIILFGKWYAGGTYQMHYYVVGSLISISCLLLILFFADWLS